MARRDEDLGQPQEDVDDAEGTESEEESEGTKSEKVAVKSKGKSRRKACEKPEGSDQKRQAFSKRKRGLILKSYQLYKLTDARVFVFIVNDKGSSWAYASPGFAKPLSHAHLVQMREYAQLTANQRITTEIMPHPHNDADDKRIDDRPIILRANLGEPGGTPTPSRGPATAAVAQLDVCPSITDPPSAATAGAAATVAAAAAVASAAAAGRRMNTAVVLAAATAPLQQPMQPLSMAPTLDNAGPRDTCTGRGPFPRGCGSSNLIFHFDDEASRDEGLGVREASVPAGLGSGNETIITPSGRRMAAAVGISLSADAGLDPSKEEDSNLPLPGPHSGGTMLALDRAAAVAAGLPPPSKQARCREPSTVASDSVPQLPPGNLTLPLGMRSRRGEPPQPPSLPAPSQRQARPKGAAGPNGSPAALFPNSHDLHANDDHQNRGQQLRQMTAAAAMYQQAHTLAGLAMVAAEEDLRRSEGLLLMSHGGRGDGGSNGPNALLEPQPPLSASLLPPLTRPMPSYAPGSRLPFTSGDIVRGNDGQLYRVLQELVEPEEYSPPDDTAAAARVLMLQPSGQTEIYITSSQIVGGGFGSGVHSASGALESR